MSGIARENKYVYDVVTTATASLGTVVDSNGYIKFPSHNLITYSEELDNAAYIKSGLVIDANTSVDIQYSPTVNALTAEKVVETANTEPHKITIADVFAANETRTFGIFAKAAERSVLYFEVDEDVIYYDLENEATVFSSGTSGIQEVKIISIADGWYACTLEYLNDANTSSVSVGITEAIDTTSYLGNTSSGMYLWGAHAYKSRLDNVLNNNIYNYGYYVPTTDSVKYYPRIDHDPVSLEVRGLLCEEERTNTLADSNDFTGWTLQNWGSPTIVTTITPDAIVGPDGRMSASKVVPVSGTTTSLVFKGHSLSGPVMSVYAKAGEFTRIAIGNDNGITSAYRSYAVFDLANGVHLYNYKTSDREVVYQNIEDVGNGWYRISVITDPASTSSLMIRPLSTDTTSGFTSATAGDGSSGLYIYGAQVEDGNFPTSYIPTYGASATRTIDNIYIEPEDIKYNTNEGSFYIEFQTFDSDDDGSYNAAPLSVYNTITRRFVPFERDDVGSRVFREDSYIRDGGNVFGFGEGNNLSYPPNTNMKFATAFKPNDYAIISNYDGLRTTSPDFVINGRIYLGRDPGRGKSLNGHIKDFAYYPRRLSNNQLKNLIK